MTTLPKSIFFTSDWHIGHKNVLNFCPGRKCENLDDMYHNLIQNYNNTVKEGHICYHLGDISFGKSGIAQEIISQLNGTKIALRGNHDKGLQALTNVGFVTALDWAELKIAGYHISMSHFPLYGIGREDCSGFRSYNGVDHWHGEKKYMDRYVVNPLGKQDIHLHGHIHSPNRGLTNKIHMEGGIVQYDVGVDAHNMFPVSLKRILYNISQKPQNPISGP